MACYTEVDSAVGGSESLSTDTIYMYKQQVSNGKIVTKPTSFHQMPLVTGMPFGHRITGRRQYIGVSITDRVSITGVGITDRRQYNRQASV